MIVFHWLRLYWAWAGSNVGAMPACGLVALIAGYAFRRPLERAWKRLHGVILAPLHEHLAAISAKADAAHRIAADTHRALTGLDHPDAPEEKP